VTLLASNTLTLTFKRKHGVGGSDCRIDFLTDAINGFSDASFPRDIRQCMVVFGKFMSDEINRDSEHTL
jgi:hypothetical protein